MKQLNPSETHSGGRISRTKRDGWEEVSRVTDSQVSNTSNLVNRGDSYKKNDRARFPEEREVWLSHMKKQQAEC